MNTDSLINSVALFFEPSHKPIISRMLVDQIVGLSVSHSARPLLFTASGDGFELDDCYLYSDETEGLELWNTSIPNGKRRIQDALRRDAIVSVWFDVPLATSSCRSEWSFN